MGDARDNSVDRAPPVANETKTKVANVAGLPPVTVAPAPRGEPGYCRRA